MDQPDFMEPDPAWWLDPMTMWRTFVLFLVVMLHQMHRAGWVTRGYAGCDAGVNSHCLAFLPGFEICHTVPTQRRASHFCAWLQRASPEKQHAWKLEGRDIHSSHFCQEAVCLTGRSYHTNSLFPWVLQWSGIFEVAKWWLRSGLLLKGFVWAVWGRDLPVKDSFATEENTKCIISASLWIGFIASYLCFLIILNSCLWGFFPWLPSLAGTRLQGGCSRQFQIPELSIISYLLCDLVSYAGHVLAEPRSHLIQSLGLVLNVSGLSTTKSCCTWRIQGIPSQSRKHEDFFRKVEGFYKRDSAYWDPKRVSVT